MKRIAAFLGAVGLAAGTLTAQSKPAPAGALYGADATFRVPRTPDGRADLQGVWANNGVTPMTRPTQWKDKAILTDAELTDLRRLLSQVVDQGSDAIFQNAIQLALDAKDTGKFNQTSYDPTTGNYNQFWMSERELDHRTSLIVDPPDGQFPPLTPEAQARRKNVAAGGPATRQRPNGPEDLPLSERCITFGAPRTGAGYNSYVQIVQSPQAVVLLQEMIHDARIIPIGGRPRLQNVRHLHGDPRGSWDGDTLVVESTNYVNGFQGSSPDVRLTERYTRVSRDYINWVITVDDPTTWTRPWSFMTRLKRTDDQLYEYACHEGNYAMPAILGGARAEERKEAAAAEKAKSSR